MLIFSSDCNKMNTTAYKKIFPHLLFLLILFLPNKMNAQLKDTKVIHPLMGTVSISQVCGATFNSTDYSKSRTGLIWKTSVGYYFNTYSNDFVAIKVFGGKGYLSGEDINKENIKFNTPISFFGTGVNYGYRIEERFFPSLFAGFSYLHFDPEDIDGNKLPNNESGAYNNYDVDLNFELGLQYLIFNKLTLDVNAGVVLNFNDWLDDIEIGGDNDIFYTFTLGVTYYPMAENDGDNDGVGDSQDLCQDTQKGVTVDDFGCPVDTDHDNIPDYLDRCTQTPPGVIVDVNGCPLDNDLDGVPDYLDRCPGTLQGLRVNRYGCPNN